MTRRQLENATHALYVAKMRIKGWTVELDEQGEEVWTRPPDTYVDPNSSDDATVI